MQLGLWNVPREGLTSEDAIQETIQGLDMLAVELASSDSTALGKPTSAQMLTDAGAVLCHEFTAAWRHTKVRDGVAFKSALNALLARLRMLENDLSDGVAWYLRTNGATRF